MKDIEHASINGVEIHNLAEQDNDETILYSGELWLDGKQIGSFCEDGEGIRRDIRPEFEKILDDKITSYLQMISDEEDEENEDEIDDLTDDFFFEDLIELELYLQEFRDGVKEGYSCLLVNYPEEGGVELYSVESADDVEDTVRDNDLTDFQTFYEPEHFIINSLSTS